MGKELTEFRIYERLGMDVWIDPNLALLATRHYDVKIGAHLYTVGLFGETLTLVVDSCTGQHALANSGPLTVGLQYQPDDRKQWVANAFMNTSAIARVDFR